MLAPPPYYTIEEVSHPWMRAWCERDPDFRDLKAMDELTALHWKMIATDQDVAKLEIDYANYLKLYELNRFAAVLGRWEGNIVGYFACLIAPHPHYKGTKIALEDVHFVHPDHRRHHVGDDMLMMMEAACRKRGAQLMKVRTKLHAPNHEWLEKNGFKPVEMTYTKVL